MLEGSQWCVLFLKYCPFETIVHSKGLYKYMKFNNVIYILFKCCRALYYLNSYSLSIKHGSVLKITEIIFSPKRQLLIWSKHNASFRNFLYCNFWFEVLKQFFERQSGCQIQTVATGLSSVDFKFLEVFSAKDILWLNCSQTWGCDSKTTAGKTFPALISLLDLESHLLSNCIFYANYSHFAALKF